MLSMQMGHRLSAAASADSACCSWLLLPLAAGLLSSTPDAMPCQERHAEWPSVPCASSGNTRRAQDRGGRGVARASRGAPGGPRSSDGSLWCSLGQRALGRGSTCSSWLRGCIQGLSGAGAGQTQVSGAGWDVRLHPVGRVRQKRREAPKSSSLAQCSSPRWALASCQQALGKELACLGPRSPKAPSQTKPQLAQCT